MIQEFEDHVKKLRQSYVNATLSQRISVARQRMDNTDCGPNRLCTTFGALEAMARAVLLERMIKNSHPNLKAYEKIRLWNATKLIESICAEQGISATDFFGQDWEVIQCAEKYRNLLTHEATFLREDYSSQLIGACQRGINKIEQDWLSL